MKYEGYVTCLSIHSSTRKRLREIIDSTDFSSYEELINYLLDKYLAEKNEEEHA
jgi:hypothetical protein